MLSTAGSYIPFRHSAQGIIQYALESVSDFLQLKTAITNRAKSLLGKQATKQQIVSMSPVKSTRGLQPNEVAALALVMANVDSSADRVSTSVVKQDMQMAGYTRLATQLALTRLSRMRLAEASQDSDGNGYPFVSYRILEEGESWLLEN